MPTLPNTEAKRVSLKRKDTAESKAPSSKRAWLKSLGPQPPSDWLNEQQGQGVDPQ